MYLFHIKNVNKFCIKIHFHLTQIVNLNDKLMMKNYEIQINQNELQINQNSNTDTDSKFMTRQRHTCTLNNSKSTTFISRQW